MASDSRALPGHQPQVIPAYQAPGIPAVPMTGMQAISLSGAQRNIDLVTEENRKLRMRLEKLNNEHRELKRAYWELSLSLNHRHQEGKPTRGHDMHSLMKIADMAPGRDVDLVPEEVHTPDVKGKNSLRLFEHRENLEGHAGAVYSVAFSRKGNLIATGSFDKSVRIWALEQLNGGGHSSGSCEVLQDHSLNVSEVAWGVGDAHVVSSSYDKTVKLWDVQSSKLAASFDVGACALSVAFACATDDNMFWAATSQGPCHLIDKRAAGSAAVLHNDAMVNTLLGDAAGDGARLTTGDSRGLIKCWDVRALSGRADGGSQKACEVLLRNADAAKPISHLAASAPLGASADDPLVLAANCYDDVLRVYARDEPADPATTEEGALAPEQLRLTHSLHGHANKNLPIRSALFRGAKYAARAAAAEGQRAAGWGGDSSRSRGARDTTKEGDGSDYGGELGPRIDRSLLLATGSADKACYVFDVAAGQVGALVQRLDGHSDRVYATAWHPTEPTLATASGDFTVKLWTCK